MKKIFLPLMFLFLTCNLHAGVKIDSLVNYDASMYDAQNDKQIKFSDFKGKVVILEWFNPGCPFVKKHYESNNMQALQVAAKKLGAVWITVSSSAKDKQGYLADKAAVAAIMKEWKTQPAHVVLDHTGELGKFFEAKVTPHMFIINAQGNLAYMGAIDSIKSADKKDVNVKSVVKHFEIALKDIAAGKPTPKAVTAEYGCGVKYAE